jgi:hypothetical protein
VELVGKLSTVRFPSDAVDIALNGIWPEHAEAAGKMAVRAKGGELDVSDRRWPPLVFGFHGILHEVCSDSRSIVMIGASAIIRGQINTASFI